MDVEKLSVDGFNLNVADAKARDMISDKYDPDNGTYVVGDTCINDDILYICNTDIDTPENFDSTKWDADTVGHYCTELKSNLTDLTTPISASWVAGTYTTIGQAVTGNITLTAGTYLIVAKVPVVSSSVTFYFDDGTLVSDGIINANLSYVSTVFIYNCSATKTCHISLGQSASVTLSYIERGQFKVFKLA